MFLNIKSLTICLALSCLSSAALLLHPRGCTFRFFVGVDMVVKNDTVSFISERECRRPSEQYSISASKMQRVVRESS